MSDTPDASKGLPPSLRLLKGLVIVLMLSMIGGVIAVVWLLVTRLPEAAAPPALPDHIALPAGAKPEAVTMARDWIGVATTDGRLFVFNRDGSLRQEIDIAHASGG